jgi:antagonist of KipI
VSAGHRLRPVGESALCLELGQAIDPAVAARVRALDAALHRAGPSWLRETVPTYRSLLVLFDPAARAAAVAALGALATAPPGPAPAGACHDVPVVYGGAGGPDLEEAARHCGLAADEFARRHAQAEYTAFMLGFMPGFAYLGLLDPALETPRRRTPRVRVEAGAVAVAGRQTAVYPLRSPGGWNLIGRTALALFDPHAAQPVRIRPGDRVRFRAVDALEATAATAGAPAAAGAGAVEVIAPGLLTTVQDRGRPGWRHLGVPAGGALDTEALDAANAAVGNMADAAGLECVLQGPELRFRQAVHFAVAGGDLGAVLERADLGPWPVPPGRAVLARAGNVLRFSGRRAGCRAYVAFAGGLDVPPVLGARSTLLSARCGGLEGRALRAGDTLALLPGAAGAPRAAPAPRAAAQPVELRVVLGPQDDAFTAEARSAFLHGAFVAQPESDRVGCRLGGPALTHAGPAEIVSDGMVPGCVQVPPDGQPIVIGADGPTTGGYPKIATVIGPDLPLLGQVAPGDTVHFRAVTMDEALAAR